MIVDNDTLTRYLSSHLTAAGTGVRAFDAARKTWSDHERRADLTQIREEVAQDQRTLGRILREIGGSQHPVMAALQFVGARVSEHNPINLLRRRGGLAGQAELESLAMAVTGKDQLWLVLERLAAHDERIHVDEVRHLHERAVDQRDRLERLMGDTVPERFTSSPG